MQDRQSGGTKTTHQPARLKHIRELDGVRGIAALAVFFHHAFFANLAPGRWPGATGIVVSLSRFGYAGVDLFFVLSGFLITSLLIQDRTSPRYYQDFYWKRALRILPLFLVILLIMLAITRDVPAVLLALIFLSNFTAVFHIAPLGPFWTLAIEEQFYLLWPTAVRRLQLKHLQYFAMAIGLSSFVLRLVFAYIGRFNYRLTFLHCDGLAFGAVLACHLQKPLEKKRDTVWLAALLGLGVICAGIAWRISWNLVMADGPYQEAAAQSGVVLLTGGLVGLVIVHSGAQGLAVLRSRVLTFFGLISYALYMMHDGLMTLYDRWFGQPQTGDVLALYGRMGAVMVVTIVLCLVSRYALELPVMSLRKYVLSRPTPNAEHADPPLPLANL